MTPRKQTLRHRPEEGIWGDCHRTAIACLLDLDPREVPHFGDGGPSGKEFNRRIDEFLATRGLCQANVPYQGTLEDVLLGLKNCAPRLHVLFGGESRTGCGHTVIACDGEIVWDPSLTDSGITGPMDDGFFWVTFLVPLSLRKAAA